MQISELWYSPDPLHWDLALERYWTFVLPENLNLERTLGDLKPEDVQRMAVTEWYDFLHDQYFRWKYTAKNRYATTIAQLERYISSQELDDLDWIRQQLLTDKVKDIRWGLNTAMRIRGLGTAGGSGLLSLMYPQLYATVDQFVVKGLRLVENLPEKEQLLKMKEESLSVRDGELLISILTRKANENCSIFGTSAWTPRRVDMVLWAYGR